MEVPERILDTAFGLFRQYGTRSITMDDIAMKLGISKKTLYAHFTDKNDLVVHAIDRFLNHIRSASAHLPQKADNAIEELFLVMLLMHEQYGEINPVIMSDLQKFHPSAFALFQDHKDGYMNTMVRQNLERGIREGLYRPTLNLTVLPHFRTLAMTLCLEVERFNLQHMDMWEIQKVLVEHFLYGVASLKGYQLIEHYRHTLTNNK